MPQTPVKPNEAAKDKPGDVLKPTPLNGTKGKYTMPSSSVAGKGGKEEAKEDQTHWIEIKLLDDKGKPVTQMPNGKGVTFRLAYGGKEYDGELDGEGKAHVDGLPAGNVDVSFPEIDGNEWRRK